MTYPTHTLWSDAEALFLRAFAPLNVLTGWAGTVGSALAVWGVGLAVVLAVAGLALCVRSPK